MDRRHANSSPVDRNNDISTASVKAPKAAHRMRFDGVVNRPSGPSGLMESSPLNRSRRASPEMVADELISSCESQCERA